MLSQYLLNVEGWTCSSLLPEMSRLSSAGVKNSASSGRVTIWLEFKLLKERYRSINVVKSCRYRRMAHKCSHT